MKHTKRLLGIVLVLALVISILPASDIYAASKKVKLNKTKATVYVGKTVTLKLKNNKKKIKWSSSNKKIASVSKKGKVTGKKVGKAIVTAKVGKKKYKCKVTVKKKKVKVTNKPEVAQTKPVETKKTQQSVIKPEEIINKPIETTKPEPTTTKPIETTKPEQPTTKPVEEMTTKPSDNVIDPSELWDYEVNHNEVKILEYKGREVNIVIPSEINGKTVTGIGNTIFVGQGGTSIEGYVKVNSITIPDTITYIEEDAFESCALLKNNIVNNSNLESSGYWGALICDREENGILIKNNEAIRLVDKNIKELKIPEGVLKICDYAFACCDNIERITISNTVKEIGKEAFDLCGNIRELYVPSSVQKIDETAFDGCFIFIDNYINNSKVEIVDEGYSNQVKFYDEFKNELYIRENVVIGVSDAITSSIIVPEGVTEIMYNVFSFDWELTSIKLPTTLKKIGNNAFVFCSNLKEIIFPEGLLEIGDNVFERCYSLGNITIPSSVQKIGEDAFKRCYIKKTNFINNSSLDEKDNDYWGAVLYDKLINDLYIENNVVISMIDRSAETNGVTSLVIPEGVTGINSRVLDIGYGILEVTLPSSLTYIGEDALQWCYISKSEFDKINLNAEENKYWGAKVYDKHVDGMYIYNNEIIKAERNILQANIPEGITKIGESAFYSCVNLTYVKLPSSLREIADDAFYNCRSLEGITIPKDVSDIGENAFEGCSMEKVNFINNSNLDAEANNYWGACGSDDEDWDYDYDEDENYDDSDDKDENYDDSDEY